MTNLFLVQGRIEYTPYMNDSEDFEVSQLVWADSIQEAEDIFDAHWENKSEMHSDSYRVLSSRAMPTLGIPPQPVRT